MADDTVDEAISKTDYPPPPPWKAVRTLELIYQLNARGFELCAQALSAPVDHELPQLLTQHRKLWLALDEDARRLTARIPYVIFTMHFDDARWWQAARAVKEHYPPMQRFPEAIAEDLTHETLMFAWHAVQLDATVARSTVGMAREVAAVLAGLSMFEVRQIATRFKDDIALRWSHLPDLWERLLHAGVARDPASLAEAHRHFKLLLCGELRTSSLDRS